MEIQDGQTEYENFINFHKYQLESSVVPEVFWPSLYRKLKGEIFDAGSYFTLMPKENLIEFGTCKNKVILSSEEGIRSTDGEHVYLVDHAWTFEGCHALSHLEQVPGLLERMVSLMNIDTTSEINQQISDVYKHMWKYCQTYSVGAGQVEDRMPMWYIMDEFGSSVLHSDQPNCRIIPFYFSEHQIFYSILFPIKDISYGEEITRDFVEGPLATDPNIRKLLRIPWFPIEFEESSLEVVEPDEDYFLNGHVLENEPGFIRNNHSNSNQCLQVFSDYRFVKEFLTDSNFQITEVFEEADILWLTSHFKNYKDLSQNYPNKYINQFPYEYVITVKDLLNVVCRRVKDEQNHHPKWLPLTYNLKTELRQFVCNYQQRLNLGLDNHWICKPWNLARGLDTYITDNLDQILRLPFSGPKIAQKYIQKPVLFDRCDVIKVKFDVRYVILLKSVRPLTIYCYRHFFLRFANKPFDLNNFHDYEKHFTVNNYNESDLYKMLCQDFIIEFNKQYSNFNYTEIEKNIFKMIKEIFIGATMRDPPCGIGAYPQSRALYAADIMLSFNEDNTEINPQILEINWMPDCQRACEYYPDFYNSIFLLLFKDVENLELFEKL